jgi:hypothetical protein
MTKLTDESIDYLEHRIGMDTATLLVDPDSEDRHFIGEALLGAAILFLLTQYFTGVAKGLGVEEAGVKTGETLRTRLDKLGNRLKSWLASGSASQSEVNQTREELKPIAGLLSQYNVDSETREASERKIEELLLEHGAVDEQARTAAITITRVLFSDANR